METQSPQRSAGQILIAEDNRVMADVIRFNLERSGFAVTIVRSGTEAWECLQTRMFDFVITDYQMPGLNGEELCKKIRGDVRLIGVPIILLSAKGLEIDSARLIVELGLHEILFKPFSPLKLIESIEHCLAAVSATL